MSEHAEEVIRPMRAGDADAVAALVRQAFAAQPMRTDPPSSALKETGASIAAALARGGGGCVAVLGARLVGAILWEEKEGGLYFGRLSVAPDRRGRGLAGRLVDAAEAEARRLGLARLTLQVRIPLLANRRFFAARGFVETGASAHPGYGEPTTMGMAKRLPAGRS